MQIAFPTIRPPLRLPEQPRKGAPTVPASSAGPGWEDALGEVRPALLGSAPGLLGAYPPTARRERTDCLALRVQSRERSARVPPASHRSRPPPRRLRSVGPTRAA